MFEKKSLKNLAKCIYFAAGLWFKIATLLG